MMSAPTPLDEAMQDFNLRGFTIARGVFSESECDAYITYFMDMVERGGDGWAEVDVEPEHEDPLMRYPRLLQPHRGDDGAFNFMVDERLRVYLTALCGTEPFAVQTMVYFKPPGARGQNLHQDNTYLKVQPGTCIAAWLALDECDEENGCMMLVPDSQDLPILCQKHTPGLEADCWWNRETPVPPGLELVPAHMKRGDVLLFGGSVIHGSYKNRSNRFRRTLIGHYIAAETHQVAKYYFPVFRFDGTQLTDEIRPAAEDGGPCGVYVETEQGQELVMAGSYEEARGPH